MYEFEESAVRTENSCDSCGSGDAFYITHLFQAGGEPELQQTGARLGLASARFKRNNTKKEKKSIFGGRISDRERSIRQKVRMGVTGGEQWSMAESIQRCSRS